MQTLVFPPGFLKSFIPGVSPEARSLVRAVFHARPGAPGLTTQEIYAAVQEIRPNEHPIPRSPVKMLPQKGQREKRKLALQKLALERRTEDRGPVDPKEVHPIRSVRFLKKMVLEDMAKRGEVCKVFLRGGAGGTDESRQTQVLKEQFRATIPTANLPMQDVWLWRYVTEEERRQRLVAAQNIISQPKPPTSRIRKPGQKDGN
ncbi:hypothetical protein B0H21DRAFT_360806 [Amylocystis lapponica]|nr:hypothetical protein B0H21DRAFT_360806 [Amylocystis lapponica]